MKCTECGKQCRVDKKLGITTVKVFDNPDPVWYCVKCWCIKADKDKERRDGIRY